MKVVKCKSVRIEEGKIIVIYLGGKEEETLLVTPYGLDSAPVKDGKGISIQTGISDSNNVFVGGGGFNEDLLEGEVVLYNQSKGSVIKLGDDGLINIRNKTASLKQVIETMIKLNEAIVDMVDKSWQGVPVVMDGGTALQTAAKLAITTATANIEQLKKQVREAGLLSE